ncbi:MAG: peptidoglycan DD-metalloendopeptidase family protein [Erysipelotrichaceae bacterium]|nr:peptidoglycan DD-metalloendopeptidase family protein [Erysipelotrichaceae bacterium]MBR3167369.1 peptidoglycan DD-metalloendopeptidase family protein [Erysipelotrichaceae bacterium]
MKKISLFLCMLFVILCLSPKEIILADDDYDDSGYWLNHCSYDSDYHDSEECDAYRQYLEDKKKNTNSTISDLKARKENIGADLDEALEYAKDYANLAAQYESEIQTLRIQIKELNEQIDQLTLEIETNKALVEALNERVLSRMRNAQGTMHFNPQLDFILGSKSFDDLNRRSYGVQAIMQKDKEDREELLGVIKKLEEDEKKLQESKEKLDADMLVLEDKQAELYAWEEYYRAVAAEFQSQYDEIMSQIEEMQASYAELASMINLTGMGTSGYLASPVPGAGISAGTWYYPSSFGGGVHLGVDYAVGRGTNIYSPANGVILVSSDGCGDGWLGNSCSGGGGGVAYGGNQVTMMVAANGSVYGVIFFHMLYGSPAAVGPIEQGQYVGRVGSSGNSTGAHCHIELFYLGPGDITDLQEDYMYRSYSQSFNCGWGSYALNRLCENGVGAPCRLKPENYFG